MSMLTAQANHLREMAYTVERVKNDAVGKLSLSGSISLATAAMDMRDAADTIAQLRNTCHDLQRENAKLKDENAKLLALVRDMWQDIPKTECSFDVEEGCCDGYEECHGECALWYRMHELGIEA
jgi:hypothetical protein